jgi:hypothetical protein
VLENAGVPVALYGAGVAVVPEAGCPVNVFQGTKDVGQIMAAIYLEMPVHVKMFEAGQTREAAGQPPPAALQIQEPLPGVKDDQGRPRF